MISFNFVLSVGCLALLCASQPAGAEIASLTDIQKPSAFTPEQHQELKQIFISFVEANPKVIKNTLEKFMLAEAAAQERKEKALAVQRIQVNEKAIFQNPEIPFLGNPSGDRVIAVFVDPYCGYCRKSLEDLEKLTEEDKQVKVIIHDVAILGESSEFAVKGLLAAKALGKYKLFQDALKKVNQPLDQEGLKKVAIGIGMDGSAFIAALSGDATSKTFETYQKLVGALKLDATPTLVYNRELVQGYMSLKDLQKRLGFLVTLQGNSVRDEG